MKRKHLARRTLAVLMALCLTAGASVMAAESDNMANFQRTNTYNGFSDIPADAWYASAVQTAVELGIMQGKTTDTFAPTGNLSLAEAITMACRVDAIYRGETFVSGGSPWYQNAIEYAVEASILRSTDQYADYTQPATRADMACIFGLAIPSVEYQRINRVGQIPDVTSETNYATNIYFLYSAGIVAGDNGTGKFRPNDYVNRAEAAAIIGRVALPANRLSVTIPAIPTPADLKVVTTLDGQMNVTIPAAWVSTTESAANGNFNLRCDFPDGDVCLQILSTPKSFLPDYDLESFSMANLQLDTKDSGGYIGQTEPDGIIKYGLLTNYYMIEMGEGLYYDVYILENSQYFYVVIEIMKEGTTSNSTYKQLLEASSSIDPAL